MSARDPGLDACGCCELPSTEVETSNRPGLPALRYRVGTHATFLRRMLARLPSYRIEEGDGAGLRPLLSLTTRAADDASVALLDAWATVADVLTFYQERIANEGFLETSTERRSVLELARAIGYELSPGVAASAYVAFTVEQPPVIPSAAVSPALRGFQGAPGTGAPTTAIVPAGTQIKSIPGPDELPQTFEIGEELEARAEWNALRPRLTFEQLPDAGAKTLWVEGIVTDIKAGGRVLILSRNDDDTIETTPKQVTAVVLEDAQARTRIELADATSTPVFPILNRSLLNFAIPTLAPLTLNATSVASAVVNQSWRERDLSAFFGIQRWNAAALSLHINRTIKPPSPPPSFELEDLEPGVVGFTMKAGVFGHNAPRYLSLPSEQRGNGNLYPIDWDLTPPSIAERSDGTEYQGSTFFFERSIPEVLPASWVLLEGAGEPRPVRVAQVTEASLADFSLSGRATGVLAVEPDGTEVTAASLADLKVRTATVHAASRPLVLVDLPIETEVGAGTPEEGQLTLDGLALGLPAGRPIAVTGERADLPGVTASEIVILAESIHSGGLTTLFFETGLQYSYVRATVALNANVVLATHGEAVTEVLGNGAGAIPNQRFTLRKPPLTYVSAATASGTESTLELRVNDVLWKEEPSLYGLPPDSRAYTVRLEDDGETAVVFGDGVQGARLPTGSGNVVARYRTGIGLGGEVGAGSLTVLQTRPLGIREVTNPVAASGAADPEVLDDARSNAPLTVRTLGRIVSLQDYSDFARGFAGIGKADAVALWTGHGQVIAVTVASASGEPLSETSETYRNLTDAIDAARVPLEPVRVVSFQPVYFNVEARVLVDPAYLPELVLAAVENALLDAFAFEQRDFGAPVTAAEVVEVAHRVEGVVAVDLDALFRVTETGEGTATLASFLPSAGAHWEGGEIALAELLQVNPVGIALQEMTA